MSPQSGFHLIFWKPDCGDLKTWREIFVQVVLNTRDIKDSATIFGFPVSIHKKSNALFKKFHPKLDEFGDLAI